MHIDSKRGWTFVVLLAVLLVGIGAAVAVSATDDGRVDRWDVEDRSGDPSPVAIVAPAGMVLTSATTTTDDDAARRRRGRVRQIRVRDHSGPAHVRSSSRGGATEWCRVARGYVEGGNVMIHDLVHATISQRFCYVPSREHITELGPLNLSQAVSGSGSLFLWHNSGEPYAVRGEGESCGDGICWEYRYRRGVFAWERGWGPVSQQINGCVSITMRGTGRVIVGKPNC